MKFQIKYALLGIILPVLLFSACKKEWDDHNAMNDPAQAQTILEAIKKDPQLSKFSEYLEKTGYDNVIAASKTFTIWAPTDAALQNVDPSELNTDEKLKLFVGNHIATQAFLSSNVPGAYIRVKTLSGKNVTLSSTSVDGIPLLSKDYYVGNGVIHTINSAIVPKLNAWEYLMSTQTLQKQELQSLNYSYIDYTRAEEIGINPTTGKPVYKEGTGIVKANRFLNRHFRNQLTGLVDSNATDISNENGLFTYVVLTDDAFKAEKARLSRFYSLSTQDSTDSLTGFSIIKDLVFKGVLEADKLPSSVYSIGDSVRFHLQKSAIVETHHVSNGIVYVMNSIDYDLTGDGLYDRYTKIKPIIIEGESANNSTDFFSVKSNSRPVRKSPDGRVYTQLLVTNHGVNTYWVRYRPAAVNSVKYKVYWRVARDYNLTPAANASDLVYSPMRVAFKSVTPATAGFNYVDKPGVLRNGNTFSTDYSDYFLGEYTPDKYYSTEFKAGAAGGLSVFLVGNTVTTNGQNDLLLDYIKMVPVL